MPVSASSKGGPAAITSAARRPLSSFKRATIATRSIGSSFRCARRRERRSSLGLVAGSRLLRVHVLECVARIWVRPGSGELKGCIDHVPGLRIEPHPLLIAEWESSAEILDRVARLPQFAKLILVPVDLRIADVMAGQALRRAEQKNRAATSAHMLERLEGGKVDGLYVLPVHLQRAHPIRCRTLRQVLDRLVLRLRGRFRPTNVLLHLLNLEV